MSRYLVVEPLRGRILARGSGAGWPEIPAQHGVTHARVFHQVQDEWLRQEGFGEFTHLPRLRKMLLHHLTRRAS